ncbi:MAG: septation protein SepH [Nocardioidaceae bacterium]
MRKLRLVGLSADGRQVILVDNTGAEFAAPADDRLRAALRGDRARLGQLEIEMDSALRPRDIQARIRAGDTPEEVAVLAQVSVDKIMPYCVPVLAERQHVAELARRSHVRRKGADGPSRGLADVVAERLRGRGVDALGAEWDAWRREDGRWAIQASYHSGERERSALFIFDAVGRYSLADDDEAKWLTGERQSTSKGPQPREGGRGGDRRLSAVPDGDDLLSLSEDGPDVDEDGTDDLTAVVRAVRETPDDDGSTTTAEPPSDPAQEAAPDAQDDVETEPPHAGDDAPTEPTPQRKRRSKRASVPSWDEIMFGKDDA